MYSLGGKIRIKREEKKLTQAELGKNCGVSQQAIDHYEKGLRVPTVEMLYSLSKALGVTMDWLAGKI